MDRQQLQELLKNELNISIENYNSSVFSTVSQKKIERIIKKIQNEASEKSEPIEKIFIERILREEYILYKKEHCIVSNISPLRYPGAKSKVLNKFVRYFNTDHIEYREPFVGGASIFLGKHLVEKNFLNDKDYNVYAFLYTVKNYPEWLCSKIRKTIPTIELWKEKKSNIQIKKDILDTAFDFFFFNRTNYSGIFYANPLGGLKQDSKYKIDCRWNKDRLCKQIQDMHEKLQTVELTNIDFEEVILREGKKVLLILDPPYYHKGDSLYPLKMKHEDHLRLAKLLNETNHHYLITIDDSFETRDIYTNKNTYINQETWKYTVHSKKNDNNGKELLISNFKIN